MTETPDGSTEREGFSDDIGQLIIAVRALIGGHWDLFRAELGAISRDAVGVLLGAIAVITLVTAALLALLIALFMLLGGIMAATFLFLGSILLVVLTPIVIIAALILRWRLKRFLRTAASNQDKSVIDAEYTVIEERRRP